ncbi:unnamed protein product [Paramecium primaurelia]|uniref:non-specific serine/threonine protein kinase n=1 Tax=Paramecium primaurelia TaxID=5886 RepID=A0A8S1NWG8_PARPR|nr:unnamed protein product [Paramecium primaurelia]
MSKYLDKYVEYETIGRGSYGSAHLVRSKSDQQVYVAKKIQLFNLKSKEQDDSKREVMLLQKLKHPHIVQYIESFNENDTLIIVMEYCEEGDLSFHINRMSQRKEYFPEQIILNWFLQCSLALKYIHEQKILHRDIKSQNIFLSSNGFVKIGDFGISRVLEHTQDQANTVVGTPYYMSPEVCENKPYTYKSDVWSLGCVLYELCNLSHAFKSNNLLGLVNRIVKEQASAIPSHYSKELADLINKLLIKNADQRPHTSEIFNFPLIRNTMQQFVAMQGKVQYQAPIKRTNTHNQIGKMIKQEETTQQNTTNPYDNTIDTVQSIDFSQLTPQQRLQMKKEEKIQREQRELAQASKQSFAQQQASQQRKIQDLQGGQSLDYNQKRKQQQQYHEELQRQQQFKLQESQQNTKKSQQPIQSTNKSNMYNYDETLVSQYEKTSLMLQNESKKYNESNIQNESKKNNETFKKELEQFDKTVDSEMCQSTYDNTVKQQEKTVTKSQLDRFTTNYQKQELSVTQQYQDEEFEEYNSDDDEDNHRLTVKQGDSEIEEVLKLYQIQMDQTIKKSSSNKLEDIQETSQESWNSSQASPQKVPINNDDRIQILRKKVIATMGSDLFNKAYQFMSHHLSKGTGSVDIRKNLEEIVGKSRMGDCMLIDEILYYENYSK